METGYAAILISYKTSFMRTAFILPVFILVFTACSYGSSICNDSLLTGTWKGTSICQVRPSPCNDEIAVYHITKGTKPNIYHMVMNKLVNGVEEEMGENDYTFNAADHSLFCYNEKYKISITLTLKADTMEGSLYADKTLYRVIKLKKVK